MLDSSSYTVAFRVTKDYRAGIALWYFFVTCRVQQKEADLMNEAKTLTQVSPLNVLILLIMIQVSLLLIWTTAIYQDRDEPSLFYFLHVLSVRKCRH